jgi:hypoxanthine-DNA glycosylase
MPDEPAMSQMIHPFEPVFNEESRVLILGTFPSIKSRSSGFYYGHPQNRFWKVIAHITKTDQIPQTIDQKKRMLLKNKIALWDVLQRCDIKGSSDSSIKNAIPTDLSAIFKETNINCIYANGLQAYQFCCKYYEEHSELKIAKLPSTSAANAKCSLEQLVAIWGQIIFNITSVRY